MHYIHANFSYSKFRLAWIPDKLESNLRASITERQLVVPTGIPVRLIFELIAPLNKRPLCQPVAGGYNTFSCLVV
jgi:hypothetical protein